MPIGDLTSVATAGGAIFWIGIAILFFGGGGILLGSRGRAVRSAGVIALVGVVIAVGGIATAGLTTAPASTSLPTTTCGQFACSINTLLKTTPALIAGETWNQQTSTLTVLLLYNNTGNYFCVASTFAATHGCASGGAGSNTHPLDVVFPLNLVRVDAYNGTALFSLGITTIPTALSLGSSASLYSIIGFKGATSTTPGQWQVYNSAGTLASQYPSVNAPSQATNVMTDGIAVPAFSSTADTLHIHLAGTNSTSAPNLFAQALTNYTAYNMGISVSQSTPASITVTFELIGWTT